MIKYPRHNSSAAVRFRGRTRRGAILAAVLVEFIVAAAILFAVLQAAISHHRHLLGGRQQLQSQWLTQAGMDRAIAQLRSSTDYRGETWHVPAADLDGIDAAEVQISLEPVPDQSDDLHLTVAAKYPADAVHCVQQTQEATIHLK
ncbi:MAG TPA: hypothetical protein VGJ04_09055 [Pirellulales bacterium]|jgi:hypothetical protein